MAKVSGEKLYVNMSVSQVRKLLQGRGWGVRRVEVVDEKQSMVIHTATGQHRRDLEALLANATRGAKASAATTPVDKLRNLGPVSAQWLRSVGIKTKGDLQQFGSLAAFRLVQQKHPRASLHLLWAIVGALRDQDWRDVSARERKRLRAELESD